MDEYYFLMRCEDIMRVHIDMVNAEKCCDNDAKLKRECSMKTFSDDGICYRAQFELIDQLHNTRIFEFIYNTNTNKLEYFVYRHESSEYVPFEYVENYINECKDKAKYAKQQALKKKKEQQSKINVNVQKIDVKPISINDVIKETIQIQKKKKEQNKKKAEESFKALLGALDKLAAQLNKKMEEEKNESDR